MTSRSKNNNDKKMRLQNHFQLVRSIGHFIIYLSVNFLFRTDIRRFIKHFPVPFIIKNNMTVLEFYSMEVNDNFDFFAKFFNTKKKKEHFIFNTLKLCF